jgi:hypothetical protein
MQLMPHGDYYVWYCEWCDTRNQTVWTRIEKNQLCCSACHKMFPAYPEAAATRTGGPQHSFRLIP